MAKNKQNITLDKLAGMIKRGFDETAKKTDVDRRFEEVDSAIKNLREENSLEHEEIKLRLSQVAYRFELEEIDKRLKRVEAKVGIIKIR